MDDWGRVTKETSPAGNVTYTQFDDVTHETRVYPGWHSVGGGAYDTTGPVMVSREDRAGNYTESLSYAWAGTGANALPLTTANGPAGTESLSSQYAQIQTLSRSVRNESGQTVADDRYFGIPANTATTAFYGTAATLGTAGTNYYRTNYWYDHAGRRAKVQSPTGTISRTVYDGLGRVVSTWVGTDDTASTTGNPYWSPTNTAGTDLVKLRENVYDNGGAGDGTLTRVTQFPYGSTAPRVTDNFYDWRDRLVATKGGVGSGSEATDLQRPLTYLTMNNLGEVTAQRMYDGDGVSVVDTAENSGAGDGVPDVPSASNLRALSLADYDDQGRVFRTTVLPVAQSSGGDPTTGVSDPTTLAGLRTLTWYDHRGNVIKTAAPGGLLGKTTYDGIGRPTVSYTTDGGSDTDWTAAGNVTGDAVLEQAETTYDADGNPILTTSRQRFHDETGTGALGTPTSGKHARVSYLAQYFDAADRLVASVDVGTNGGSAYTRPTSVPARSATNLVTSYLYNSQGLVSSMKDPRGIATRTFYDALGRTTKTVEASTDDGTLTSTTNRTTRYAYDGGDHVTLMTADLPGGGYQRTAYAYGVTAAGGSGVTSNDLLAQVQYPDPSTGNASAAAANTETYAYDALGEPVTKTDRNGGVHAYVYDDLGRLKSDSVTTLGSGVNGDARRLGYSYDTAGRPWKFTTYPNADGTGTPRNQVRRDYNGLGQLTVEYQSHSDLVNTDSTPKVQHAYSDPGDPTIPKVSRLKSMTYPNGRVVRYEYSTGLDNNISRLSYMADDTSGSVGTHLEEYTYLGLGTRHYPRLRGCKRRPTRGGFRRDRGEFPAVSAKA